MNESDYYKILEISRNATKDDIKQAYRKLAMLYHPDRASADMKKINEEKFKEIAEAYAILSNDEKKIQYDESELSREKRIRTERERRAWDERIRTERENGRMTGQNREYIYKTSTGQGNFFPVILFCAGLIVLSNNIVAAILTGIISSFILVKIAKITNHGSFMLFVMILVGLVALELNTIAAIVAGVIFTLVAIIFKYIFSFMMICGGLLILGINIIPALGAALIFIAAGKIFKTKR
ncbi:putative chaperone protein DnaJ [groundwater metagenome]|uniref:Putative chaperone protein DnaJ n=1 Tax=groundwater metagenome TaxID=717931 RepID=A0A098EE02_9ZZZZ